MRHIIPTVFGPIEGRYDGVAREFILHQHEPVGRAFKQNRINCLSYHVTILKAGNFYNQLIFGLRRSSKLFDLKFEFSVRTRFDSNYCKIFILFINRIQYGHIVNLHDYMQLNFTNYAMTKRCEQQLPFAKNLATHHFNIFHPNKKRNNYIKELIHRSVN